MQGYTLEELLHQSSRFSLYRARTKAHSPGSPDSRRVILKILHADLPEPADLARLRYEMEHTPASVDAREVVEVRELTQRGGVLVLADPGGELLKSALHRPASIHERLALAMAVARSVGAIHRRDVVHKNLNPYTIFAVAGERSPEPDEASAAKRNDWRAFLTGFEFSARLSRQGSETLVPDQLRGAPAYISPEQTGRMNQSVDQRSDLYSLGVLLYEIFAGRHPFPGVRDTLDWVHCHIAREPAPLSSHRDGTPVPEPLPGIVARLLAKSPGERYQSARGVLADLEYCGDIVGDAEKVPDAEALASLKSFVPGARDRPERLQLSQNLYGRTFELDQLLDDFAAVAAGGRRLVFVTGASGTGKSALIEELHRPVLSQSGALITGKYEQFERGVPYSAFIQAFGQIVRRILGEDATALKYWRSRILAAVRTNARVLLPVLPDLAVLLGPQPDVQELSPAEARNRFHNVFGEFVAAFAGLHHPLVIFLDDLQWADPASLDFMQSLVRDREIPYLQLIGSYRDTRRESDDPLDRMLDAIQARPESAAQVRTIALQNFQIGDVLQLIADSLDHPPAAVRRLAALVHDRTLGNPFFVRQFLFELYESQRLYFDFQADEWRFDLQAIESVPVTRNAADFMARKIERLSYSATRCLQAAACLGREFTWEILNCVLEDPELNSWVDRANLDVAVGMAEALHEGLVLTTAGSVGVVLQPEFRFLHDRVQQAAYSLVRPGDRARIHFAAARCLLPELKTLAANSGADEAIHRREPSAERDADQSPSEAESNPGDERLFEIVGHLRAGRSAAPGDWKARIDAGLAVRLNLTAARRARLSGAVSEALEFIRSAREWQEFAGRDAPLSAELRSDVAFEAIQCEYLNGNHEIASGIYAAAYEQAADDLDRVRLTIVMVTLDTNLGRLDVAIERGLRVLRRMRFPIPAAPGVGRVLWEVLRVRRLLGASGGVRVHELADRDEMHDVRRRAQIDLLMSLTAAAFFKNQNLFAIITLRMVELSLRFGNAPYSSYGYCTYGVLLQSAFGASLRAAEFARLGLRLNERFEVSALKCKLRVIYGAFINHWVDDIRASESYLSEAYAEGLEHGDLVYAGYALANRIFLFFVSGGPLAEADEFASGSLSFARRTGDRDVEGDFLVSLQASRNLRGETRSRDSFSAGDYDEEEHIRRMRDGNPITFFFYYLLRIRNQLIHREFDGLRLRLREARALLEPARPLVLGPEFIYLGGLSEALCEDAPRWLRRRRLKSAIRKFEAWARQSPLSFEARLLHLKAEYARMSADLKTAARLYGAAIDEALERNNLNVASLASEQAGRYFESLGMRDASRIYLGRALQFYQYRGVSTRVAALKSEFAFLFESGGELRAGDAFGQPAAGPSATGVHAGQTTAVTSSGALDVQSITRASRMISQEIVVGRLLEKIMDLLLKEAGANRGALIRRAAYSGADGDGEEQDSSYMIVASGAPDGVTVYPAGPAGARERAALTSKQLPRSMVQYVIRTGESIILNDVERDRVYREDDYIRREKPRSLLCMPIRARGELTGVLYLENDLVAGAFTEERLEVLGILSAQAAVSLENAILYDDLEQRVVERTAELEATLERVQELKVAQDCDYYLTALLIQPLAATAVSSATIQIHSLVRQLKRFQYKKWSEQIGGDINVARSVQLQGRSCTVFFQGDAMGKSLQGAGGALVFGAVVESLIAGTEVNVETAALAPDVWLMRSFQELHRVFESFHGYMLMSVMLGIIEDDSGRIHMINGDHPPAVLFRDGRASFLDRVPITHKLGAHWYRRDVAHHEFQLQPGDVVVIGSDGRDDLLMKTESDGEVIMNEDPNLFLRSVEASRGDIQAIYEAIQSTGEIKDDLSLMSVAYRHTADAGSTDRNASRAISRQI